MEASQGERLVLSRKKCHFFLKERVPRKSGRDWSSFRMAVIFSKKERQSHLLKIRRSKGWIIGKIGKKSEQLQLALNYRQYTCEHYNLITNKQKHLLVILSVELHSNQQLPPLIIKEHRNALSNEKCIRKQAILGQPPVRVLYHSSWVYIQLQMKAEIPIPPWFKYHPREICLTFNHNLKKWKKKYWGNGLEDKEKQPALPNRIRKTSFLTFKSNKGRLLFFLHPH